MFFHSQTLAEIRSFRLKSWLKSSLWLVNIFPELSDFGDFDAKIKMKTSADKLIVTIVWDSLKLENRVESKLFESSGSSLVFQDFDIRTNNKGSSIATSLTSVKVSSETMKGEIKNVYTGKTIFEFQKFSERFENFLFYVTARIVTPGSKQNFFRVYVRRSRCLLIDSWWERRMLCLLIKPGSKSDTKKMDLHLEFCYYQVFAIRIKKCFLNRILILEFEKSNSELDGGNHFFLVK